ncbi:MAG: FadR/GntR family transcriptional regulator [Acidimicrobiia bacterium]
MSRLNREAMSILLGEIVAGRYSKGDRLPKENDLTERFRASRGTVRESVRALEERGLINVVHGVGAVVEPTERWNILDADVLAAMLATDRSTDILRDFLETRRILEVEAVALAAERATEADLDVIKSAFERLRTAAEATSENPMMEAHYLETDVAYHAALFQATGNLVLSKMVEPLQRAMHTAMRPLARPERRIEHSLPEHERIMLAVINHDVDESRAAMEDHLATSFEYLNSIRTA